MSSDNEFENLIKFLTFLRKDPLRNFIPQEISKKINLPLETVKSITEEAILNQWVSVDHRGDDGTPVIKINYDGNKKLNQLTGKADLHPSQSNITNISVSGKNINIGNKINSDNVTEHIDPSQKKWIKWGVIIAGITLVIIIIFGIIPLMSNHDANNESTQVDGVYGDVYKSYSGGFYISRPNINWDFIDIEKFNTLNDLEPLGDDFIDGIVIDRNTNELIIVRAYEASNLDPNDVLLDLSMTIRKMSDMFDTTNGRLQISDDGKWALHEFDAELNGESRHAKQKVEFFNNKKYIIETILWEPNIDRETISKELDFSWNSFSFCKNAQNCDD